MPCWPFCSTNRSISRETINTLSHMWWYRNRTVDLVKYSSRPEDFLSFISAFDRFLWYGKGRRNAGIYQQQWFDYTGLDSCKDRRLMKAFSLPVLFALDTSNADGLSLQCGPSYPFALSNADARIRGYCDQSKIQRVNRFDWCLGSVEFHIDFRTAIFSLTPDIGIPILSTCKKTGFHEHASSSSIFVVMIFAQFSLVKLSRCFLAITSCHLRSCFAMSNCRSSQLMICCLLIDTRSTSFSSCCSLLLSSLFFSYGPFFNRECFIVSCTAWHISVLQTTTQILHRMTEFSLDDKLYFSYW